MKGKISNILFIIFFIAGLSLLLYPSISDYWNSMHQSRAVSSYAQVVAQMDNSTYEHILEEASAYNQSLVPGMERYVLTEEEKEHYNSLLNVSGTGIMSYIEIPSIKCTLPVYHGTDDAVLQIAIGHIEGSSLPVGGESSHCILSGHRGLPSAKLFSDLDQMAEGDVFVIRTLDQTLTYEVDQIRIVLPHEMNELEIIEGQDLCTLVTCTPYGVNSHRLLVRGHRIENPEDAYDIRITADAVQIDPTIVAPVLAAPMLLIFILWVLIYYRKR